MNLQALYDEMTRAGKAKPCWVMNLDEYKDLRRHMSLQPDGEEDEGKWIPNGGDRMFGMPITVRDNGGEPHIEWLTREDMK